MDLTKELVPSTATTAYVKFLERVASNEVCLWSGTCGAASFLLCMQDHQTFSLFHP